ncbi:cysteinyl-tRNA synthetase [Opitutaceae bacterium TAV1]|nr:cysteinyl-tRNA synthetase [Opitutaceae bacterium TAV1]
MAIRLHDSLSRETRELRPSQPDGVFRFYNCGPTVYAAAHIGNFRTFVVNDLLRRLLEIEFGPEKVRHVRNLTDVDDKTIRRSREEHRALADVTRQWTEKFHADCAALGCLPPHVEPAATTHIPEQIDMIAVLERKGHAYRAADGSVYFKVSSFPGYGALSRVKERELKPGSALAAAKAAHDADEKEDGSDFALWKAHKPEDGDVFWPSPWGQGRPGWHIECSAMSKKHLGDTIDLHTGGVDLLFPHHENEIAQSQCCNGTLFAHHWYHSEHLLVDGKKMSKSLNNLYTLDQLRGMGHAPAALRYALLAGHPRKQLNFTLDSLHAAEKALATLRAFRARLEKRNTHPAAPASARFDAVLAALHEDLNTPAALGALFGEINSYDHKPATHGDLAAFDRVVLHAFGFDLAPPPAAPAAEAPADVTALAEKRWAAKQKKDFAAADALRAELAAAGWAMLDRKDGYSLEPARK